MDKIKDMILHLSNEYELFIKFCLNLLNDVLFIVFCPLLCFLVLDNPLQFYQL